MPPAAVVSHAGRQALTHCALGSAAGDFGLGVFTGREKPRVKDDEVAGTPGFIAPEILQVRSRLCSSLPLVSYYPLALVSERDLSLTFLFGCRSLALAFELFFFLCQAEGFQR